MASGERAGERGRRVKDRKKDRHRDPERHRENCRERAREYRADPVRARALKEAQSRYRKKYYSKVAGDSKKE